MNCNICGELVTKVLYEDDTKRIYKCDCSEITEEEK